MADGDGSGEVGALELELHFSVATSETAKCVIISSPGWKLCERAAMSFAQSPRARSQ
jgi:hypothetical protein